MSVVPVPLHGFGKLPLAGDFIHFRLEGDEARAFVGWLERGQALVESIRRGGGEDTAGGAAEPRRFRFAFDPGNGRRLLVGVLRESHDRGALRRFPFALFASLEASGFRERPSLMPLLFAEPWEMLDTGMESLGRATGTEELFGLLSGMSISVPEAGRATAKDVDGILGETVAGEFWTVLLGEGSVPRRAALFDLLVQTLLPFRKNRPEEVPVALKLPLAGGARDVSVQSVFWVELLAGMLRGARLAPSVFLSTAPGGGTPTSLHVFFQRADETNFAALLTRRYEADYVSDLTDPRPAASPPAALGGAARRQIDDEGASLQDLVRFRWIG
jgi:type VI secretion system ImpM family protein